MVLLGNYSKNDTTPLGGSFSTKMCTHQKYVTNPYNGQRLKVKCGKCEACKQERANRLTSRINNHASITDKYCFFLTLTYDERFVPYVKKEDLENEQLIELNVYRDYTHRYFMGKSIVNDCSCSPCVLGTLPLYDKETGEINREYLSFHGNLWKKDRGFHSTKCGVIWYKDWQNYAKRVRTTFSRRYGDGLCHFDFFASSEYGENHYRPHFHALVFAERQINGQDSYDRIKTTLCDCWPFADRHDLERSTGLAFNAAAYVSSYVNSPADLPDLFPRLSPQKHSFSRTLGVENDSFSLHKILALADNGTLVYGKSSVRNGVPVVIDVPIPKYVISRYFPLFKGLNRCSPFEICCAIRFPFNFFRYHKSTGITNYDKLIKEIDDTHTMRVRMQNARNRYIELTGKTSYDYFIDYVRVWNCYKSTLYKLLMQNNDIPWHEKYDNINELYQGYVRNDSLSALIGDFSGLPTDVNDFKSTKRETEHYAEMYRKRIKHGKENNFVRQRFLYKNI